MLAFVFAAFLAGYTSMISLRSNECRAAFGVGVVLPPVVGVVLTPSACGTVVLGVCVDVCILPPTSSLVKTSDQTLFDNLLKKLTNGPPAFPWVQKLTPPAGVTTTGYGDDGFIGGMIDTMVQSLLIRLNQTELDLIDWWDTMWWYNLRPALQSMTRQLNVATTQQAEDFQSGMDAFQEDQTNLEDMHTDNKNHQQVRVSEHACVAATASGGFGRASGFSRAMRAAWQDDAAADGQNRRYTTGVTARPAAIGQAAKVGQDAVVFESTFCDPADNNGYNVCAGPAPVDKYGNSYANADTMVTKNLYNKLTMQVDDPADGPTETKIAKAVVDNTMGDPTGDPMPESVMSSPAGHERWMNRRSYLARYAAIRSVPQLIAGWRMPGSKLGPWIQEIEKDSGVTAAQGELSDNPSYREIVHAISIDRLNSSKYANNMITDEGEIQMEKLTLSSFYLMQLRDYYELLEREALTLAVQVSLMAEKIPVSDTHEAQPVR